MSIQLDIDLCTLNPPQRRRQTKGLLVIGYGFLGINKKQKRNKVAHVCFQQLALERNTTSFTNLV